MALESWRVALRAIFRAERPDGTLWVSDRALEKLAGALATDDPTLIQSDTTLPCATNGTLTWPVEAACLVGYCGWQDGHKTVLDAHSFFGDVCFATDRLLGAPGRIGQFLLWYDDTPRADAFAALRPEVALERERRSMVRRCEGDVERAVVRIAN